MARRLPIISQISWPGTIPQLVAGGGLGVIGVLITHSLEGLIGGLGIYLTFGSRAFLLQSFRRGMQLLRREQYSQAIKAFEEFYQFITRHEWIDRYRCIVMMSPSAISNREMALVNIAFCHVQLKDGARAKEYYQRALAEFPESVVSNIALTFIEAIEAAPKEPTQ